MIETTYTLTEAEYRESIMLALRYRESGQFRKRWLAIVCISALAISIPAVPFYVWLRYGVSVSSYSYGTLITPLILETYFIYLLSDLVTFRALKKRIGKLFKESSEGQTNVHLRIDELGWHDDTPGIGTTFVEWNAFSKLIESNGMFLLLRRTPHFHMLPKRVLTPLELTELRDLVSRHLSETKST